jgi:hypothetical protein
MKRRMTTSGWHWVVLGIVLALSVAGLTPLAQAPAGSQSPTAAPPQPGAPAQGQAPDAGRGRGGRGGNGGPQQTDPANADADFTKAAPVLPLSPAEQAKHFVLQPGYHLEPVLTDPVIEESTAIAFDGNGRMFVLEDRGYMQDADAGGERDPVGRISLHEDVNGDGVYEKHSVFVDKLVLPRFVQPFGANSVLTMETDSD